MLRKGSMMLMNPYEPLYDNREDAGQRLAERLMAYKGSDAIVLALPRGGVPVGYEVARALGAPLDVLVARKLGAPDQPELGIGAVAPGVRVLNEYAQDLAKHAPGYLREVTERQTAEVERRVESFRGDRPPLDLRAKVAIIVDDGLATGVTARAAIRSARRQGARKVVLAVPVCASDTAEAMGHEADDFVCLDMPRPFYAVGLWYSDFAQTSDEEVRDLLERSRGAPAPAGRV